MNNEQNTENPMAAKFKTVQGAVTKNKNKTKKSNHGQNKSLHGHKTACKPLITPYGSKLRFWNTLT